MPLIPLLFSFIFFSIIKLSNLGVRLSDTNVYFYTALQILQGKLLYKDIFFTNLPLFPYISSLYLFLSGKNIYFYYFTSTLEVLATTVCIYLSLKLSSKQLVAMVGSILYLFSFIILTTSDHQTGVFLAALFSVVGYYFFQNKKYLFAGIFLGLTLTTKAYFLPIALSYIAYFIFKKNWKGLFNFSKGIVLTVLMCLGPFLIFSQKPFIADTVGYSLHRAAGLSKIEVLVFFLTHDLVLCAILFFNLANVRKNKFFFFVSLFSLLFLVFYQDIYYLYLNFFVPYLLLSLPYIYTYIEKLRFKKVTGAVFIFVLLVSLINFIRYVSGFQNLGRITNIDQLTNSIKQEKPSYLYGVDSLTPALAALTSTPLLDGVIDTNENIFRSGVLDKNKLTDAALNKKTVLVSRGISYPTLGIEDNLAEGIFSKEKIARKCKLIVSQDIHAEGAVNKINLFRCY